VAREGFCCVEWYEKVNRHTRGSKWSRGGQRATSGGSGRWLAMNTGCQGDINGATWPKEEVVKMERSAAPNGAGRVRKKG
jgi:hypothetical protein